jgi:alpha-ketoglutarate-dependent taurine dioxygenase
VYLSRLLYPDKSLPLVLDAQDGPRIGRSVPALIGWITDHRDLFESWLAKHGAVLLRGFAIDTPEEFESVVEAVHPTLLNYVEGDSPRTKITGKVYTSTEYPETYQISLHNELSYAHKWPCKIFFYCATPPAQGGETPIADCREVLEALDRQICEQFISRKVKYVNTLHGGGGVGKSWQDTFETNEKSEVVRYLTDGHVDFTWDDRGTLRTSQIREAVITHPVTGDRVWFNQAEQWHPSTLDLKNRRAMTALGIKEEDLPHYASFGDGDPLDEQELNEIRRLMRDRAVYFPWQKSDLLVLDNVLVAHGRNPFKGPRKILVAMA